MEYQLVEVRKNEVFTNSKVIANGTGVEHRHLKRLIEKYKEDIEEFGTMRFKNAVSKHENSNGASVEKIYLLNEEQATFIITLMRVQVKQNCNTCV